ncbi:spore coat protein [Cytobacillus sp. FJAT-54145]|uniref:Spore coat protein n=1 Tax=Cytobacillus spartinae TaxID=3299023 RepID=A0ABW6K5C6_9BACI
MNNLLKSMMGMGGMTDQVIATDFLISAKAAIKNLSFAVTETATPELREALRQELKTAIRTHEDISNFMISRGMYYPDDLSKQLELEYKITDTALNLAQKQ